jgi:zinc transport system permease protein
MGSDALLLAEAPHWLDRLILRLNTAAPPGTFFYYDFTVRALLALVLVSLVCGGVGSLVVGGRMAFFSDALAHCAFAGVSVGFLLYEGLRAGWGVAGEFWDWVTPVMVAFGMLIGYLIALVRLRTGLASDTVIGVFFAASIGLAAMLRNLFQSRQLFNLEDFLFGNPLQVRAPDIVSLGLLLLLTAGVLAWTYNHLLLAGFNPSLALSRRVPVKAANYVFVILLAVIVNLCLRFVGALLINALLVVPAATAVNLSRNMRQLFWGSVLLCLGVSLVGLAVSWEVEALSDGRTKLGIPGTIILLSVTLFGLSLLAEPIRRWRARRAEGRPGPSAPRGLAGG